MGTLRQICCALALGALAPLGWAGQVTVLGINDMHASIDNMPKLATLVKQERARDPQALLFSAGDNRTGNPFNDMYPKPSWPMVALMNRIGFNLSTLGNHSFDAGMDAMRDLIMGAEFRVVCANVSAADKDRILLQPYRIFERNGVKVGVLGLLQLGPNGIPDILPEQGEGFTFRDPFAVAQEYKWLRDQCDVLIFLTHLGFEDDVELARQCPWVDAIIGGHTHTKVDGAHMVGNVMVTQAGCRCGYLTRLVFDVQEGRVAAKEAKLLPVADCAADPEAQEMVDQFKDDPYLQEQIAVNAADITEREGVGCLFADAQREKAGCDIAVANFGSIRVDTLPAGPLRMSDVFRIDPFGNDMVLFRLTGEELADLLTNISLIDHHGMPSVSGMGYTAKLDRNNKATLVEMHHEDGSPIDPAKTYTVVTSSFVASSTQFKHADPGRSLKVKCCDAFADFLKKRGTVDYSTVRRAKVIREVPRDHH